MSASAAAPAPRASGRAFVKEFIASESLNQIERDVLRATGVASAEDIDSLFRAFPSLAGLDVRLPRLSSMVVQSVAGAYETVAENVQTETPIAELGANAPPGAAFTPGSVVNLAAVQAAMAVASPPPAPAIDLRPPGYWPVRNQGRRGTCVAHGATACVEHATFAAEGPDPDYSEQFLYWAIKTKSGDPKPTTDGTWLRYAAAALAADGICREPFWPYVGAPVMPISGQAPGAPAAAAIADAAAHLHRPTTCLSSPAGAASRVRNLLATGSPVAISLPVFRDPSMMVNQSNWTTAVGWSYGRVLNPPPTSVAVGGHCVCIMGFVPDADEPNGGWFILRNSWDTVWAALAPAATASNSPEPGYGDVSATYVEQYCWEVFQL